MEISTSGALYNMAAANMDTDIVFPNLKKKHVIDQKMEDECARSLKTFAQFGGYALELLPKVIDNIWKYYNIEDQTTKEKILCRAGLKWDPHLRGVETSIS